MLEINCCLRVADIKRRVTVNKALGNEIDQLFHNLYPSIKRNIYLYYN